MTTSKASSTFSTTLTVKTTTSTSTKQSSNLITTSQTSVGEVTTATSTTITVTSSQLTTITTNLPPAPTTDRGVTPTSTSAVPDEDPHCPTVLPKCLDKLLPLITNCKDSTDNSCYCPDKQFVEALYNCIASDSTSDAIFYQAVRCFQDDCSPYSSENPVITTGTKTYTEFITVPGTAVRTLSSAKYTTWTADTTKTIATQVVTPVVTPSPQIPTAQPSDLAPIFNDSGIPVVGNPPNATSTRPSNSPVTAGAPVTQVELALGIAVFAALAAM